MLTLAVKRFKQREGAIKLSELVHDYDIPGPLADQILSKLQQAGLLNTVSAGKEEDDRAYQPTFDPDDYTVNGVVKTLSDMGNSDFIPKADSHFAELISQIEELRARQQEAVPDIRLLDLP